MDANLTCLTGGRLVRLLPEGETFTLNREIQRERLQPGYSIKGESVRDRARDIEGRKELRGTS